MTIILEVFMDSFVGKMDVLFSFMKENGYPVYHLSNIFYRDLQYAIRDYIRATEQRDIGWRKSDELAGEFAASLEKSGVIKPFSRNTWVLHDERYRLPSEKEKEAASAAEAESVG